MKSISKAALYKRQTTLMEVGEEGQQKIADTSVLVVGCGGLGGAVAVGLATSGIGQLHLVDFDVVTASNLHRQIFYSLDDIGVFKATCLSTYIQKRAPYTKVNAFTQSLTKTNVLELIEGVDIVVDATDSLPTKYLLNDACVIKSKPLVYGSLYKFDGYVAAFNIRQSDGTYSANLRDAFPEMATDIPTCEEAGTLNPIVSIIASLQVNEVLKISATIGSVLVNELLIYNSLQNSQLKMKVRPSVTKKEISSIFKEQGYVDLQCELQQPEWIISSDELKRTIHDKNIVLVSVIDGLEAPFNIHHTLTLSQIKEGQFSPLEGKKYVMICKRGITSYRATQQLKEQFPTSAIVSLIGGINDYRIK